MKCLVACWWSGLCELDRSRTAANYAGVSERLKATSAALPAVWYTSLRPQVMLPSVLSPEEARALATEAKQKLHQRFTEQYEFEISTNRDDILDRLPSKRRELERIAKTEGEKEAARILSKVYDAEHMGASEKNFMASSKKVFGELMEVQQKLSQEANISNEKGQLIATQIIDKITDAKKKTVQKNGIQK